MTAARDRDLAGTERLPTSVATAMVLRAGARFGPFALAPGVDVLDEVVEGHGDAVCGRAPVRTLMDCNLVASPRGAFTNETVPTGGSAAGMNTSTPVWNGCVGKNGSRSSVESPGDDAASWTCMPITPLLVTLVRALTAG